MKATSTATRIGRGWGKNGMNDNARNMLRRVRMKAIILRPDPSRASSSFSFCMRFLYLAMESPMSKS